MATFCAVGTLVMRTGLLYRGRGWVSDQALVSLVASVEPVWAYVENEIADPGEYAVNLIFASDLEDPAVYLHGRVSGLGANLIWQSIEQGRFLVCLLTTATTVDFDVSLFETPLHCTIDDDAQMFLWGTHASALQNHQYTQPDNTQSIWIETRIPRPLVYPVDASPVNVKLIYNHFRIDGEIASTFWSRIVGVNDD